MTAIYCKNKIMEHLIIYQFCNKNYSNDFQMMSKIYETAKDYKADMMDIERYSYDLKFFEYQNPMILVDIVPPFLNPDIFEYNFDNYKTTKELMPEIEKDVINYNNEQYDPEKCLVIRLIHDIPIENSIN
jgi:hypothetical protein